MELVSIYSQKRFKYVHTPDGSDQRRAQRELDAHNRQLEDAANERAKANGINRPLSAREIREMSGGDRRPTRALPSDPAAKRDLDSNPYQDRLDTLKEQRRREFRPTEQRKLDKLIEVYTIKAEDKAAEISDCRAQNAILSDPNVDHALKVGRKRLESWAQRSDLPQTFIDRLAESLETLATTGNHPAFWDSFTQLEGERSLLLEVRAEAKDREIARLQSQAAGLRSDKDSLAQTFAEVDDGSA